MLNFLKSFGLQKLVMIGLLSLAILGVGGTSYFYHKYQALKANPNLEAQKETETLLMAVSKLMELPKDETPTFATVSQKEKLAGQGFFKAAENGDIVLAYSKSMQAILYRPSTNKIINVAPIFSNSPQVTTPPSPPASVVTLSLRIAYYNGTETVGLSGLTEKRVKEKYPNWETTTLTNAAQNNYKQTLVIDVSGQHAQEAKNLAQLLDGKVASLPKDEVIPNADILVISGK